MVCKNCGTPLSKKASVCAYCGEPAPDHTTGKLVACVIFVGLILFLLIWYPRRNAVSVPSAAISTVIPIATASPAPESETTLTDPRSIKFSTGLASENIVEYILKGFSSGLTETDLSALTEDDLLLLRTGLYAISGLEFDEGSELNVFFRSFPWYSPNSPDPETVFQRFNVSQKDSLILIEDLLKTYCAK